VSERDITQLLLSAVLFARNFSVVKERADDTFHFAQNRSIKNPPDTIRS
jgi:hypothetical protein